MSFALSEKGSCSWSSGEPQVPHHPSTVYSLKAFGQKDSSLSSFLGFYLRQYIRHGPRRMSVSLVSYMRPGQKPQVNSRWAFFQVCRFVKLWVPETEMSNGDRFAAFPIGSPFEVEGNSSLIRSIMINWSVVPFFLFYRILTWRHHHNKRNVKGKKWLKTNFWLC